jgi:hypothetical protein
MSVGEVKGLRGAELKIELDESLRLVKTKRSSIQPFLVQLEPTLSSFLSYKFIDSCPQEIKFVFTSDTAKVFVERLLQARQKATEAGLPADELHRLKSLCLATVCLTLSWVQVTWREGKLPDLLPQALLEVQQLQLELANTTEPWVQYVCSVESGLYDSIKSILQDWQGSDYSTYRQQLLQPQQPQQPTRPSGKNRCAAPVGSPGHGY